MARLRDVPNVVRTMSFTGLARKLWTEIEQDAIFTWASSLAYSWIFALFPFMIFLLSLAPYMPGSAKQDALKELEPAIRQTVSGEVADQLVRNVHDVMQNTQGGLLSFGLLLALWGASGGMTMTMTALDKAYEVESERSFLKHRLVAIGLTIAVIVLVLIVLVLLPVGGAVVRHFKDQAVLGDVAALAVNIFRYVLAILLLLACVSLIYYFGPNIKQRWHTVTPGAVLTVALWILMGFGFGFYVSNFGSFNKTYGTLGAAIILLLFFYLSAAVLLIGAELNSVLDFAVLGVKPGTRDFTAANATSDGTAEPQRKDAITPARSSEDKALRRIQDAAVSGLPAAPIPVGKAQAGWWKWAVAATAIGWIVGGRKRRLT
ncbi:YihY/virulence factor BrkB family protein [Humisphaera borealis]|uniref:YihY/virulence factor BrkB family protein n=1 Tax=Humisphaera borealis TaxID=2807512 RepID=A0A7M2WUF2_9BACT|nr:YihY/virulence factor BrkB family protein [Humisphaera borealis]QOV89116.1 YihY/virulence factor BrkB family protein [Humisphaera borealis]